MDFIEGLFDLGDRNNQKKGGFFKNDQHHGHSNDGCDDEHDHHNQYQNNSNFQNPINLETSLMGVVCRKCSTQTIIGAKFCHGCGAAIETVANCSSCGSLLPANAQFCAQCGFKTR
jgi:ribosomal protein L40E